MNVMMIGIIVGLSIIVILGGVLIVLLIFNRKGAPHLDPQALALLQQQVDSLRGQMGESLSQLTSQVNHQLASITQQLQATTGQIGERLDSASKAVSDVRQNLGELSKATERVFEIGKDISALQDILRPPKLRGGLGELFLENILNQILQPEYYTMQYGFRSGSKVDAVIRLPQGLVPVDAKFPLENFKKIIEVQNEEERGARKKEFMRDVRKHIDAISSKYILPDEGTFDFALMYIPAENVYYEIIVKDESENELLPYALQKRVIPVSPNSFYAYLQTILLGLKGLRIEKQAKEIQSGLSRLHGDFERFAEEFAVVGKHLSNAKNKYDEVGRALERFGDRLGNIGQIPEPTEKKALEE